MQAAHFHSPKSRKALCPMGVVPRGFVWEIGVAPLECQINSLKLLIMKVRTRTQEVSMETMDVSQWPSGSEAARTLRVSTTMLRNFMDQGQLRYIPTKLGRLIDPTDLERLRLRREREANHKR